MSSKRFFTVISLPVHTLSLFPEYSPFSKNANPGQISNYIGARVLNGEVRFFVIGSSFQNHFLMDEVAIKKPRDI